MQKQDINTIEEATESQVKFIKVLKPASTANAQDVACAKSPAASAVATTAGVDNNAPRIVTDRRTGIACIPKGDR